MANANVITNVVLADREWHKIGDTENSWLLISTGGTPIQMIDLVDGVYPTEGMKPRFVIGGLINHLISPSMRQTWCRVNEGIGKLSYHLSNDDGFDEAAALRRTVIQLTNQVVYLAGRTHVLELKSSEVERWRPTLDVVISGIQCHIADIITDIMTHKLDNVMFQVDFRREVNRIMYTFQANIFDNIKKMMSAIDADVSSTKINLNTLCNGITQMLAAEDKFALDTAHEAITMHNTTREEMVEVLDSIKEMCVYCLNSKDSIVILKEVQGMIAELQSMAMAQAVKRISLRSDVLRLTNERILQLTSSLWDKVAELAADNTILKVLVGMNTEDEAAGGSSLANIKRNLADFWKALSKFMTASDYKDLSKQYEAIIGRASFDQSFIDVINVVYYMAKALLDNSALDTEQTEQLEIVSDLLPNAKPLLGRAWTEEDMVALFGNAPYTEEKKK